MEADSEGISQDLPQSVDGGISVENSDLLAACVLCQRILSTNNDGTGDLEAISICGDCKFLFLEDLGSPIHDSNRRRPNRVSRTRYNSSESMENLFSQQISHMINLMRQNQATISRHDDQPVDGDAAARLLQPSSSRTTPSGSRRWPRALSDTGSDGFDNLDSLYGENESNVSFGGYRAFHGDNDASSFSHYGGESDISMDGHSILDTDMFIQQDEESDLDTDTDIDPMHAGLDLDQWYSDNQDEEEEYEWEEADPESAEVGARAQNFLSSPSDSYSATPWRRQIQSPEFEGTVRLRIREAVRLRIGESRQRYGGNNYSDLDESELPPYHGNSGNYLQETGFAALLEHLAESESSRRGAPPAAVSFVNSLPRIVISEEHEKQNDLACAICKDLLSVGTEVIQLPCIHLYHPLCILPWLSTRNSCPLCRYELPTDDKDYEEGKRNDSRGRDIHVIQQQDTSEDSSSDVTDGAEADEVEEYVYGRAEPGELLGQDSTLNSNGGEGRRGRWFFHAAAPIVSFMGIILVLWLGNPLMIGRRPISPSNFHAQRQHQIDNSGSSALNQRDSNRRRRRWWSLF